MKHEINNDVASSIPDGGYNYRLFDTTRKLITTVFVKTDKPKNSFTHNEIEYRLEKFYNNTMDAVYVEKKKNS